MMNELPEIDMERVERIKERTTLAIREAEVYLYRTEHGLTHKETGEAMGISKKNVGAKWAKVREKVDIAKETAQLL